MTWVNIDTDIWPGPPVEPDWITDESGVRSPDYTNLATITKSGHEYTAMPGSIYFENGVPLGFIVDVTYSRDSSLGPTTQVTFQTTSF